MKKTFPSFVYALLLAVMSHAEDGHFVSYAKLLASDTGLLDLRTEHWDKITESFYTTAIELFETSAELRARALKRVHALHPDLENSDFSIKVTRNKDSQILTLSATSKDSVFATAILDSMIEEFLAFRREMRQEYYNGQIVAK